MQDNTVADIDMFTVETLELMQKPNSERQQKRRKILQEEKVQKNDAVILGNNKVVLPAKPFTGITFTGLILNIF